MPGARKSPTVTAPGALASWRSVMDSPSAHQHLHNAVQGGLRSYDLPDLKSLWRSQSRQNR